ncbi:breast cancer type 1 susceptibility protein isoform 2-T2 [Anomaloglossus baeobatrachus]|uniref:breast cancer type 1 susceptibility protein isoform X1 n=1 Tax=Anomaloglossus baeobatrachus TaxID=238106 RepID=UPI003F4FA41D
MTCSMDVKDVQSVLSVMQKNLECPICLEIMKEPVATRCDHIFCRFCMLQLLSKKKKGRAQCPMCKKEITKRSLQDSPRFKLLVDGLLKIINAFELDSGYKFFPSQDYASTISTNHKVAPKTDDQLVVQSTGYRNRAKRGVENGAKCERRPSLLETSTDPWLARDADTWNCKQPKRQKREAKQLITDFVSDSSEDDLFKKAGSLGSGGDQPSMLSEPSLSFEPENKEDRLTPSGGNDHTSSKLEAEDVAASDLAEYGFSERDFESIRSNLLSIDSLRSLKESPSKTSAVKDHLITDPDFGEKGAKQNGLMKLDDVTNMNFTEPNITMQLEREQYSENQTLKIALDFPYDRDDSTPENMPSTQGSEKDASYKVSRHRLKKSIKKVNEWLLKTGDFLENHSKDEEMLPDIFYVEDRPASDNGSSVSDDTKIMTVSHLHVVLNAVEKNIVSVEDKVFGKVYKREKKPNQVNNVTCVADVHVNGVVESVKINAVPKPPSSKPKRSCGLQPEHFIKKVEQKEQNAHRISNGSVVVDDFGVDVEGHQLNAPIVSVLDLDKIEKAGQDLETISDAPPSKAKKQIKSLKRKNEKTQRTKMMQSLHLIKGDVGSGHQKSPPHVSEIKIDSYPSSTEPGYEVNQKNVRRSKRLSLLKENDFPNLMVTDMISKDIRNEAPCAVLEDDGPEINGKSTIAIQNVTIEGSASSQMDCDSSHVTHMHHASSSIPVPNTEEMEDSDLDTELLLKTFKSAKRMSFKLDPVTEAAAKGDCDLMDISDIGNHITNEQEAKDQTDKSSSPCNEDIHSERQCKSVQVTQSELLENLRSRKKSRLSSKISVKNSEKINILMAHTTITSNGQPNDIKDVEPLEKCYPGKRGAVSKTEEPPLQSETESMSLFPVVSHQKPAAAMRGDTRSGIGQGENEEVRDDFCQKDNFDDEQVNQMTSSNSSQGSMTGKLLGRSVSHNSSPDERHEVYSDTPDGLMSGIEILQVDTSCCAVPEKSFVFGDGKKLQLDDCSVSPVTQSQVVKRRKRKVQKLESSEEESSGDEELPCFNALFGNPSTNADQKNASASSSPRQQGGGVLAMFSSCSTSGKTQTSFNLPCEAMVCSQESQCSVNLFSSPSNTSDQSMNGATDRNGTRTQDSILEKRLKKARMEEHCNEDKKANVENMREEMTDCEDPCQEHNLGEVSGCESEASHTGDSSGLSSQCEILNTQQRDAMQNNLKKLQREMAALEAVLEQHGSQSPASGREQASTAGHVTIRPQEAQEKQTDYDIYRSPDAIPETEVSSGQGRSSGLQTIEQLPPVENRSRSPTPPCSLPQATSSKGTQEKICAAFNVFKELKECIQTDDESTGQKAEHIPRAHEQDHCTRTASNVRNSKSPKRSLRSKLHAENGTSTSREDSRQSTELKGMVQPPQHFSKHPGHTQRSVSPTFKSPLRSKEDASSKSPVVSNKRNYCLVTSGLSQSEVILVQKFARKTQSIFSNKMAESTTHVIMKTDEQLVCERTLKYFLGVAGRKWVVSHEWIVQSFREGRILDEYDFEVKGDVINGRNHRGPRRSRLGSDGLLLTDFQICCLGSYKDMTREDLEWMVTLCGASVVHDPSQFEHKSGATSLVVVQPEKESDYAAMRKKYHCLVISREWVLDSVSSYKLQAFDSYLA